ncbi:MAG: PAC2 family protein [Chitinivibrionales bacterium]
MALRDRIHFDTPPTLIAAWPGMGNVGISTVDHIRRAGAAHVFAEVDMGPFTVPEAVQVNNGVAHLPDLPKSIFYYRKKPDLLIFESNAQVAGRDGISIVHGVLGVARELRIKRIYTAAAYTLPTSHKSPTEVFAACSNHRLLQELGLYGIKPMPDGMVAGLNGLLLGIAANEGFDAACLLGSIPSYAVSLSYPRAALEIVKVLSLLLNTGIETSELELEAQAADEALEELEQRLNSFLAAMGMDQEGIEPEQPPPGQEESSFEPEQTGKIPNDIMARIEMLFDEVAQDRSRAQELREELIRWDLYDLFEDRFLNLFEDDTDSGEDLPDSY